MEHHASVTSLLIVIIVAFLTPILLHRLRLRVIPVVVAEIIMGLIIGQSGLNLVEQDMWLETLSTLGFIFLMFLSGLEIDFSAFAGSKKKEKLPNGNNAPNPFTISTLIFLAVFAISLFLSYLFVWTGFIDNAFLMTLIISTISLGVVVPTLKEAQIMKSTIGQIILLVAVIADLVTMILLAVFASLYEKGGGNTWLLLILFGAGVIIYFFGKSFKHRSFLETMSKGTIQIGTRAVFTLIIVLVAVSESIGAENILGAFLAGVLVSLLSPNPDLVHKLDSFGYGFLIPIFFVMVGVKLDVWSLFTDDRILILIPLLLLALFISKAIPAMILKAWYDTKTVLASGFLLTSTLSLVIAAATIGEKLGVIDAQMSGALILVAIISCIITPIVFKKLFPKKTAEDTKITVNFIGANQFTLPVVRELNEKMYDYTIFHPKQDKVEEVIADPVFHIKEIESYELDLLKKNGAFDTDVLVITSGEEKRNAAIALAAKEYGIERVIARVETPELEERLREANIEVFSVLLSTKALMKALIESPKVINILTNQDSALYEIDLENSKYDGLALRNFPFTGDIIFVRIFRGKDSIVPHGDTELQLGDKLIVTGSQEYVSELRRAMEFCEEC
ncbi:monovalent cation:proton antiporter family protein [Bacillus songklensis]|uniref:Monovalent cation:proton antiporter family protein n=1 Tax=Bacillus songklensis TaxID=1069116 RepID=A0ABV8B4G6_9BACI